MAEWLPNVEVRDGHGGYVVVRLGGHTVSMPRDTIEGPRDQYLLPDGSRLSTDGGALTLSALDVLASELRPAVYSKPSPKRKLPPKPKLTFEEQVAKFIRHAQRPRIPKPGGLPIQQVHCPAPDEPDALEVGLRADLAAAGLL